MKEYGKLALTWVLSILCSLIAVAYNTGDWKSKTEGRVLALERQEAVINEDMRRVEVDGSRAFQSHLVDNSRELKDLDRRVSHLEVIIESLSDLKADVREIKVRVGDLQDRQKRMEERPLLK